MKIQQNEMRREEDEIYRAVDDHRGFTRHLKDQKPELKSMLESHNRTEMAEHKINRAFSSNSPLN